MPIIIRHGKRVHVDDVRRELITRLWPHARAQGKLAIVKRKTAIMDILLKSSGATNTQILQQTRERGIRTSTKAIKETKEAMRELGFEVGKKKSEPQKNASPEKTAKLAILRKIIRTEKSRRSRIPKNTLTYAQRLLLPKAIKHAITAIDYLETKQYFLGIHEKDEYTDQVLERLPSWVAKHDPKKAKLRTHIIENTKLFLRTFRRNALSKRTGLSTVATQALSEVLTRQRERGESIDISLRHAAEKQYSKMRFSEEEMELIWRVYEIHLAEMRPERLA